MFFISVLYDTYHCEKYMQQLEISHCLSHAHLIEFFNFILALLQQERVMLKQE